MLSNFSYLSMNLKFISLIVFFFISFITPRFHTAWAEPIPRPFRFHLSVEPLTLDPTQQRGTGAMYLMNALQLPLFKSFIGNVFEPGVFQKCEWKSTTKLICHMTPHLLWSNGKPLTASDVQKTFSYFMDPKTKSVRADLVQPLKSVLALNPLAVQFELSLKNPRFQEHLSSPLLAPLYETSFPTLKESHRMITSGPYRIESWDPKLKIQLKPNPFFKGHPQRPAIEIFIIPEDTTALVLYQKAQLDFLRRLPTAYLDRYKNEPDFYQAPIARFDYIGFGTVLEQEPKLREILSGALQYDDWKTILRARGRPGCFGIGLDLLKADPCLSYEPDQLMAWRHYLQTKKLPPLELHFSTLGGEDHKRSMEWVQSEWKKNIGLTVTVRGIENAHFQKEMNESPASLFRFGVSLDHLSCANALRNFIQHPEISLPFKQKKILNTITALQNLRPGPQDSPLCEEALKILLTDHWIIPLGRIHLTVLIKPQWKGWRISELNYLDLGNLHAD